MCASNFASPRKQRTRFATHPNRAAFVAIDVNSPGVSDARSLRGGIGRGRPARSQQPLRRRGIQAAGDGVFAHVVVMVGEEGAQFEGERAASRIRADYAQVEPSGIVLCRLKGKHLLGCGEQHHEPAGAVVGPLRVDDIAAIHAQELRDVVQ